jgi:ubiquinone/menaquinone biosynthesis C-methylase UbiE
MSDASFGPLRIWTDGAEMPSSEAVSPPAPGGSLWQRLAPNEVLRPTLHLRESFEPLTLAWYQELERLRYHRHGRWIPSLLDFGKYQGERLLGLGTSLGSDLVNFATRGVEVIVANPVSEQLALVRRNFDLRRLPGIFLHADPMALPIETASVDVVFVNGLLHESADPSRVVEETYRVLKPGGKLVAIVPSRKEADFMAKVVKWIRRARSGSDTVDFGLSSSVPYSFDRRSLAQLLSRFQEGRIYRRHLRRAEVPHVCRWLPLGMLERFTGRLLLFKGFKPVSASRVESVAA